VYRSYFGLMRLVLIRLFPWSTTQSMSSESWGYLLLREIMGTFLHSILLNTCGKIRAEIKRNKKMLTTEVAQVPHFFEFLKLRDGDQVEKLKEEMYDCKNSKRCKTCTMDI